MAALSRLETAIPYIAALSPVGTLTTVDGPPGLALDNQGERSAGSLTVSNNSSQSAQRRLGYFVHVGRHLTITISNTSGILHQSTRYSI